jgi:hypothetical protein
MNTKLAKWASSILVVAGVALIGAFFLAWIRDWGDGGVSGYTLAKDKHWLYLVPASGVLLALAAGTHSTYTRPAALAAGVLVAGDFAYHLLRDMIHSDLKTWLLLGGAAVTLVGVDPKRRALRAVGGASILLALFAPWQRGSTFELTLDLGDLPTMLAIAVILVYASALAAVVAIVSAFTTASWGKKAAVAAGVTVFVTYFWLLLAVANMFLGWGAWVTLGASGVALALAVLAPAERAVGKT